MGDRDSRRQPDLALGPAEKAPWDALFEALMTPPALCSMSQHASMSRQLEWWQYYPGHVVGKGRGGLFVFNEATHAVRYFKTEAELRSVVTRERLGQPISPRKTPADGWNEAWMPLTASAAGNSRRIVAAPATPPKRSKPPCGGIVTKYPRVERSNPPMQRICGVAGLTNHRAVCECGFRLRSARLAPAGR